ncbi:triple QxxK/R motif-containing protein isoform X7 [Acinonyx jubatus]|uniref:Triple QxxK/R motif-containing protein n=1 Tax=Acinonyx jubatus TaxID=32536 RepID=A0ABM3NYP4_ACIJB|nr:triple QxxK/R motif-containing protein isoform X7 [Acinonyx jubatus]
MKCNIVSTQRERRFGRYQAFWRSKMGRKDASTVKLPVDQYRKQIGKQDYKKTKPILRATKLKAEAKKTAIGIKTLWCSAPVLRVTTHCSRHVYLRKRTPCDNSGSTLATCPFPELLGNVSKTNTTDAVSIGHSMIRKVCLLHLLLVGIPVW